MVGIASFLIASKFEDIYPPEVDEFCFLCENVYSKEEILHKEGEILFFLNFDLVFVSVLDVLDHYILALEILNENIVHTSEMILKIFLFHSHLGKFNSFKVAAFAVD